MARAVVTAVIVEVDAVAAAAVANRDTEQYQRVSREKEEILYLLRKRGFRVTKQRELILDIVFEHECASCKEIYYQANTLTDIGVLKVATLKPQTALGSGSGCQILLKNQNKIVLNQTEWTEVLQNVLRRKGYNSFFFLLFFCNKTVTFYCGFANLIDIATYC